MRQDIYISIPISVIRIAGSEGHWNDFEYFLKLKFETGGQLKKCDFPRRKMKRLVDLGWVGENETLYFLRSWEFLENKYGHSGHVRFYKSYLQLDFSTVLYWMAACWHLRIHPSSPLMLLKGAAKRRKKEKGCLQLGPHFQGVSNSLMASFFDRTKQWSSRMRRLCEDAGLLSFKRRSVVATDYDRLESRYLEKDFLHHRAGEGRRLFREVTSLCIPLEFPEFGFK